MECCCGGRGFDTFEIADSRLTLTADETCYRRGWSIVISRDQVQSVSGDRIISVFPAMLFSVSLYLMVASIGAPHSVAIFAVVSAVMFIWTVRIYYTSALYINIGGMLFYLRSWRYNGSVGEWFYWTDPDE